MCVFMTRFRFAVCVSEKEYRKAGEIDLVPFDHQLSKWFPHLIQWVVLVEQVLLEHFRYHQIRLNERQSFPAHLLANGTTGNVFQWRWLGCWEEKRRKKKEKTN